LVISGAHFVVYSSDATADRAFLRDVLGLPFVDVGHDWLIFALPPAEVAVHPAEASGGHELFLTCDDIGAFRSTMSDLGVPCTEVSNQRWGRLVHLTLPGGGQLGVYEPSHPTPHPHS
jgi:catechol 2,3-dioxygenase-like lactoylglutathione lyase family enzyme